MFSGLLDKGIEWRGGGEGMTEMGREWYSWGCGMRDTYARADTTVAFRHLFDLGTLDAEGDGFAVAATEVRFLAVFIIGCIWGARRLPGWIKRSAIIGFCL